MGNAFDRPWFVHLGAVITIGVLTSCSGVSPYREQALSSGGSTPDAVLFVVDSSGSMEEDVRTIGSSLAPKIEVARNALSTLGASLPAETRVGLLPYPQSGFTQECSPGSPLLDIDQLGSGTFERAVSRLYAGGSTPTAETLVVAADMIEAAGETVTLLLISDGLSSCGDPCAVARDLDRTTDWNVITIGFDLGNPEELRCIADVTGGRFINADDGAALEELFGDLDELFSVSG